MSQTFQHRQSRSANPAQPEEVELELTDLRLFPADPPAITDLVVDIDELPHGLGGDELDPVLIRIVERFGMPRRLLVAPAPESDDGSYRVLEDPRWVQAAREAGLLRMPVRVIQVGGLAQDLLVLILNQQRPANVAAQMDAAEAILAAGVTEEQLSRACGTTKARIQRLASLLELDPPLRQALRENRIKPQVAFSAAGLPGEVQAELTATFERSGQLTGTQVKEVRERVAVEEARRAAEEREAAGELDVEGLLEALGGKTAEDPALRVRRHARELLDALAEAGLPDDLRQRLEEVVRDIERTR